MIHFKLRCSAALVLLPSVLFAQSITQSADGNSSILAKGATLSLDITKTDLEFGYNNLDKSVGKSRPNFIYGGSVKAANKEGLGNLFSTGDIVPTSSYKLFAGVSWSNAVLPNTTDALADITKQVDELDAVWLTRLQTSLTQRIKKNRLALSERYQEFMAFVKTGEELEDGIKEKCADDDDDGEALQFAKRDILKALQEWRKQYLAEKDKLTALQKEILEKDEAVNYKHALLYGFGGVDALAFKQFTGVNTSALSSSFQSREFQGGKLGLGFNYQIGKFIFGLSYSYLATNSFAMLTPKEYNLETIDTSGKQTLTQQKKITAYSGNYGKVEMNEFSFDFAVKLKLDKEAKNSILINPYVHSQLFSRNNTLLPNSLDLGCGFYFFQQTGKFLGGFYIALPDVENNYEKMKPAAEQNLRDPLDRMSFGIVTKFSFNSFQGLF